MTDQLPEMKTPLSEGVFSVCGVCGLESQEKDLCPECGSDDLHEVICESLDDLNDYGEGIW